MNRSQLRRLARDYAAGRLDHDAYIRQRAELIDGIVAGEIAIESSAETTADFEAAGSRTSGFRATPLPLIVGAGIVVAILWGIFAGHDEPPATPGGRALTGEQASGKRVSAARVLVEDFLATRDWSGESLTAFRDSWNALTPNEQAAARAAPWFRRLAEALREEINAHKALAEFDGSGLSTTTGRRLAGFGEFLGIDAEMPDPTPPAERPSAPTPPPPLTGSQWLATQPGEDFTLQLFAVKHLDRLEHLTANHPDVPLHLLVFSGRQPRYRLVYGAFASEELARRAHEALPPDLRGETPEPFVRRIGELQQELDAVPMASDADAAPEAAPVYTLQVFASGNRDNADRLVHRYESLDLRVQVSEGEAETYRVLYGRFDTREAAQAASAKLPASMLEEVGQPLLRETTEFR